MQFQVPQFIEVEDKIFGPLTLKQFIYLAGGAGVAFLIWRYLPGLIAIPLALALMGFAGALAFIKVNNKPLIEIIEAGVVYFVRNKLYLWEAQRAKKKRKKAREEADAEAQSEVPIPALSEHKLKDLAWSLDINERIRLDRAREAATEATS